MSGWSKFADMELSDDEKLDVELPIKMSEKPQYPYGLRICLTHSELEKLGLDADCDIGDIIHLRAFATVTDVHQSKTESGHQCRIELQIEKLAVENETTEDMDEEDDED